MENVPSFINSPLSAHTLSNTPTSRNATFINVYKFINVCQEALKFKGTGVFFTMSYHQSQPDCVAVMMEEYYCTHQSPAHPTTHR